MGNSGRYISNRLRKHRLIMGYTQTEASELIGVSNRMRLSDWERGLSLPNGKYLMRLAKIYHVQVEVLYQEYMAPFSRGLVIKEKQLREKRKRNDERNDY